MNLESMDKVDLIAYLVAEGIIVEYVCAWLNWNHDKGEGNRNTNNGSHMHDMNRRLWYVEVAIWGSNVAYDEIVSPFSVEIHIVSLYEKYKTLKFYKFNGLGDLMKHIQGFHDECELKEKLIKYFWLNSFFIAWRMMYVNGSIPNQRVSSYCIKFVEQYKHNVKQEVRIANLCAIK